MPPGTATRMPGGRLRIGLARNTLGRNGLQYDHRVM
jgi:hypothetical protein